MIIRVIILSLFLSFGLHLCAQTEEKFVTVIDEQYKTIDERLNTFKMVEKEIYGEASIGGKIRMYQDKGETVLMHCEFYEQSGNIKSDYYFLNSQLYFVYKVEEVYSDPANGEGIYVIETIENLYYFNDGTMIRWIDNNSEQIENNSIEFLDTEHFLLSECVRLTELFNLSE
jgi:hypothetical protein